MLKSPRIISLGNGSVLNIKEILEIVGRTKLMQSKMMDALLLYARAVFSKQFSDPVHNKTEFLETKFPAALMKNWNKFSKHASKERHKFIFGDALMKYLDHQIPQQPATERLYFPFNLDKEHWVGIFVDIVGGALHVMDCNTPL